MRFDRGWVKIHRRMFSYNKNFDFLTQGMLTWMIGAANLEPTKIIWKGKTRVLERGQILSTLKELKGSSSDIGRYMVERRLALLEENQTITQEISNRGRIITVLNYDKYQLEPTTGQKRTNNGPTTDQHHIEEEKNKEEKNKIESTSVEVDPPTLKYNWFMDLWNERCSTLGRCTKLTPKRLKSLKLRLKEFPTKEYWADVFDKVMGSDFLVGKNDRGWKASIDWILKPDITVKVLEGMYSVGDVGTKKTLDFSWMDKYEQK